MRYHVTYHGPVGCPGPHVTCPMLLGHWHKEHRNVGFLPDMWVWRSEPLTRFQLELLIVVFQLRVSHTHMRPQTVGLRMHSHMTDNPKYVNSLWSWHVDVAMQTHKRVLCSRRVFKRVIKIYDGSWAQSRHYYTLRTLKRRMGLKERKVRQYLLSP